MTNGIAFSVAGAPVAKQRPRLAPRRIGKVTRTILASVPKTVAYEARIGWAARAQMAGAPPLLGPLSMWVNVRLEPPASASKRARADMLAGRARPTGRPDIDNFVKAVMDGCNGVAFRDDAQVWALRASKVYADSAGIDVRIDPGAEPYSQVFPLSGQL